VLVRTDGRLSLDQRVDVAAPRRRSDAAFTALRSHLLGALGVGEVADGDH
jgi:sulfonate transport system ATP-binding protein